MIYPNPEVYDGFRFTKPADFEFLEKTATKHGIKSKVTDVDLSFPLWGYGEEAWFAIPSSVTPTSPLLTTPFSPGRFFASSDMKSTLALLLSQYYFKLADEKKPTTWRWRTFVLPCKDTVLLIRQRQPVGTIYNRRQEFLEQRNRYICVLDNFLKSFYDIFLHTIYSLIFNLGCSTCESLA